MDATGPAQYWLLRIPRGIHLLLIMENEFLSMLNRRQFCEQCTQNTSQFIVRTQSRTDRDGEVEEDVGCMCVCVCGSFRAYLKRNHFIQFDEIFYLFVVGVFVVVE